MKDSPIQVFAQNSIKLMGSLTIYFDPFQIPSEFHDADFIFITHPHWDHFSLIDILKVRKEETNFIVPKEIYEELLDIGVMESHIKIVKPNEEYFFESMSFRTLPAFNRSSEYHLKEKKWMGYLVSMDGVVYFIAGDTDVLDVHHKIKADIVFLPVGGTYTMNAREAARLANLIHPHLAVPTHYLSVVGSLEDARNFRKYLNEGIACQIFYRKKQDME